MSVTEDNIDPDEDQAVEAAEVEAEVEELEKEEKAEAKPDEHESRARRMGWMPKEHWRGPPNRWLPAKEFIGRGESELPILRERNQAIDRTLARTEKELQENRKQLEEAKEVLVQMRDYARKADERGFDRARKEILAKQRAAVSQADEVAFDAAERELRELETTRPADAPPPKKEPPKAEATPPPAIDPAIERWTGENAWWFHADKEMQQTAIAQYGVLEANRPDLDSPEDRLHEVLRRVKVMYPDKFKNTRREAPATVASPGAPPAVAPKSKSKGYNELPADAKRECDRFVKQIPGFTKEEYCKTFFKGEIE